MEEKISYRRLRNWKPKPISGIKSSLAQPSKRFKVSSISKDIKKQDIAGKNVSTYEYMLCNHHIKQNYIKWATNLREYTKTTAHMKGGELQTTQSSPYKVYYKKTQTSFLRNSSVESLHSKLPINAGEYSQYFMKPEAKSAGLNSSISEIMYMNNLRNYPIEKSQSLHEKPKFDGTPVKDKHEYPQLLKKEAVLKMRNISDSDKEKGLDGSHRFPSYSYSMLRQKNVSLLNPLVKSGQKVSLPSLSWAVGLRAYQQKKKEDHLQSKQSS